MGGKRFLKGVLTSFQANFSLYLLFKPPIPVLQMLHGNQISWFLMHFLLWDPLVTTIDKGEFQRGSRECPPPHRYKTHGVCRKFLEKCQVGEPQEGWHFPRRIHWMSSRFIGNCQKVSQFSHSFIRTKRMRNMTQNSYKISNMVNRMRILFLEEVFGNKFRPTSSNATENFRSTQHKLELRTSISISVSNVAKFV